MPGKNLTPAQLKMRMQAKEEEKGEIELFYIKMKELQDGAKKVFTMTPLIVALDKLGIMIQAGQVGTHSI